LLHAEARLGTLYGVSRTNVFIDDVEKGLGFLRGYVSSAIARNNGSASNLYDFKSIAGNPRLHRLFSSESPKKKSKLGFHCCCYVLILMKLDKWVFVVLAIKLIFLFLADYEKFYPKEKKEVPKGEEKKSESKGNEMECVIVSCVIVSCGHS